MTLIPRLAAAALLMCAASQACLAQEGVGQAPAQAPAPERDEAAEVLWQGSKQQAAGRHEAAIALFERVLAMPVAPGAHPPAMMPGPVDWRGEARWGMAESRRAQGRWSEALELYRQNHGAYSRSDGCTPEGWAQHTMALTEGVCLEHLGRTNEAIALYWPTAVRLAGHYPPLAMRRLVDLYLQVGQLPTLQTAVAREEADYSLYVRSISAGRPRPIVTDEDRLWLEERMADTAFPAFRAMVRARQMAREKKWAQLLALVRGDSDALQKREAAAVLSTREAVSLLEAALREDAAREAHPEPRLDPAPYVAAALVASGARTGDEIHNISPRAWDAGVTLREMLGDGGRLQFPRGPRPNLAAATLPPVFRAQATMVQAMVVQATP